MKKQYRTLKGFCSLIEKEFVRAGFQYAIRNGSITDGDPNQTSPIFTFTMDCVHQIWQQYPYQFEFNLELLNDLLLHSYSNIFGSFLCNNEK